MGRFPNSALLSGHRLVLAILSLCLMSAVLLGSGCGSYNSGGGGGGGGTSPAIAGLNPSSGPVGTSVTITGNYFGAAQGSSIVTFYNGKAATPTSWSNTSIVAPVPTGATSGNVVVTVGGVASNGASFTVSPNSGAPAITTQPVNQTVTAGQTATFTVVASGTAPLSYQWQKNGVNISGAAAASYTTPATATTDSGSTFDVVVSNSAGTVTSASATLTVNASASKFPIKLSTNKRYFVDQNGTPWLMVMDAAHHLMPVIGSTPASIATYINSRAALGFNAINLFGACAGTGTCPTSGAAQDGQLPFLIGNQNTNYDLCGTSTPPCTSPNPAYWSQVDAVITAAQNAGLVVLFEPLPWGVNFGTAMENIAGPVNYPTNDFNFGVYLGNRYKNFPNIIWQFGQDFRHGALPDQNFMDYMAQVIAGVASVDTNHLMTAQMNFDVSYTQQGYQVTCNATCTTGVFWNPRFGNAMNVSFVYSYFETYDEALQAYNCGPTGPCTIQASNGTNSIGGSSGNAPSAQFPPAVMPTFLGEANYETANNTGLLNDTKYNVGCGSGNLACANAFITRLQNWYTMTSGGAGFEFGNAHVTHFDSSPLWSTQLNTTATQQVAFLANLFKQFNWWTFVPDQTHQVVTAGFGTYNASNGNLYNATYAATTWDGSTTAIVYAPVSTMLTADMTRFSGPVTARWYDPTTGNFTPTSCTSVSPCANSGTQNFTTPTGPHSDGTGTNDWVLVLH